MPDYPAFQPSTWDIRDWMSVQETMYFWTGYFTDKIPPGASVYADVYTVPTGKKFFLCEVYSGPRFRAKAFWEIYDVAPIWGAVQEPFDSKYCTFTIPVLMTEGQILRYAVSNLDIIADIADLGFFGFWTPGSEPQKPKEDDPEERYKLGDWNYAQSLISLDGTQYIVFRKLRENKGNLLVVKNLFQENESIIMKRHLTGEETRKVIQTLSEKPEKVKEILERLEKRKK